MFPEEKVLGNTFIVNCKVGMPSIDIKTLDQTIDYQIILNLIKTRMSIPTPLLETLVSDIEKEVKQRFDVITYFFISIQKQNPPLDAQVESSEVILEKRY